MPFTLLLGWALALNVAATVFQAETPRPRPHTRAETLKLVVADVAARAKVDAAAVAVVREEDRVWDDDDLGCPARKGLREPQPVPGYLFVVEAGGQTLEYHADRMGRIKRCPPAKPRSPGRF